MNVLKKEKIGVGGYLWLLFAITAFSGIFRNAEGLLHVLDYNTWLGAFGKITEDAAAGIMGRGGSGVNNGFFQALSIAPGVFLGVAFMTTVEHYKGLAAAQVLLSPLLKPVLGVNGGGGLALVSNLQSSDTSAALCMTAYQSGILTSRERDILMTTLYIGAALIGRFFSNGLVLFPYLTCSTGVILVVVIVMKFLAGNLMRLYLTLTDNRASKKAEAAH